MQILSLYTLWYYYYFKLEHKIKFACLQLAKANKGGPLQRPYFDLILNRSH